MIYEFWMMIYDLWIVNSDLLVLYFVSYPMNYDLEIIIYDQWSVFQMIFQTDHPVNMNYIVIKNQDVERIQNRMISTPSKTHSTKIFTLHTPAIDGITSGCDFACNNAVELDRQVRTAVYTIKHSCQCQSIIYLFFLHHPVAK